MQNDPTLIVPPTPDLVAGKAVPPRPVRRTAVLSGFRWLATGWRMFRGQPANWVLIALVTALMFFGVGAVPVIGQITVVVLTPVVIGGLMVGCRKVDRGDELELSDLFAGFRHHTAALVSVGFIVLGLSVLATILVAVIGGDAVVQSMAEGMTFSDSGARALVTAFVFICITLATQMAVSFAPALVSLRGVSSTQAMLRSLRGCLINFLPLALFTVVVLVLSLIAAIPMFLGWLVLGPVLTCAIYSGYVEIFPER